MRNSKVVFLFVCVCVLTVEAVELARAFAVECNTDEPDVEQIARSINCKAKTRLHRI